MRVEHFLRTCVPLYSKARNICLGKDVTIYSDEISAAMVHFLVLEFEKNPDCLIGDIRSLYKRKKELDKERYSKMTYLEYLEQAYRCK